MQRYVIRMFADEWRQWCPAIVVVVVIATMIGLCVNQFAWTNDSAFRAAVSSAGVSLNEIQILSITIYTIIALVSWVSLTIVGRSSIQAASRNHALWLLLGASPFSVFLSTFLVLTIVSACGAVFGAVASMILSPWAVPAFNSMVSSEIELPRFMITWWAPFVTIALSIITTMMGGVLPARYAAQTTLSTVLRSTGDSRRRLLVAALRVAFGAVSLCTAIGLVIAAGFASQLGSTSPAAMFNLAINAGGSALIAVYLLCSEIIRFILWLLNGFFIRIRLTVPALGARAAASRVEINATTIAPLAAGLGGIGLLLCAVYSVIAVTEALRPGTAADLADVWMVVAVVTIVMLMTSAAVVSLSARGREREIALLQTAGMPGRQVGLLILSESFAMSLGALIIAFVPIIAGGLVCSLVSSAALGGRIMVLWPTLEMLLGFVISWLALFFILLVPALRPLREGPGQQLREQGLS